MTGRSTCYGGKKYLLVILVNGIKSTFRIVLSGHSKSFAIARRNFFRAKKVAGEKGEKRKRNVPF